MYRIGHGFDVHRFQRGRKLILGGVVIPYAFGLTGHSDADVLLHAFINALLGAIGKGDIGSHFPDTDSRYKGISSEKLLSRVIKMMDRTGYKVINGDITLLAQKPRLNPYFGKMRANLARHLGVSEDHVNIKAVTTEGLGSLGKGQGMAAAAVVLLQRRRKR